MATSKPNTGTRDQRLPPAALLSPTSFVGALAVFVIGSLIVKAVWPPSR
jgi:hypothetical protein